MILRSRTDFNYENNFQVARGRSAYDLKRNSVKLLKDQCVNATKPEIVNDIDLSEVEDEEHCFIDFGN
jgi:hypothetical protein